MLRVIPLSAQFGITRHGVNTINRLPSAPLLKIFVAMVSRRARLCY
jgi:hypothetical protein